MQMQLNYAFFSCLNDEIKSEVDVRFDMSDVPLWSNAIWQLYLRFKLVNYYPPDCQEVFFIVRISHTIFLKNS